MNLSKTIVNSSHDIGSKDYYEWWYFHFISPKYGVFNIVLHKTDIFGFKNETYYSATFFEKNGTEPKYLKGINNAFDIKAGGSYLKTSNDIFKENRDHISLNLVFDNGLKITGKIKKSAGPFKVGRGYIYSSEQGFGMWVPQFINSHFSLKLIDDKQIRRISGISYHDHQWGDISINKSISHWIWGHFVGKDVSLVLFKILLISGIEVNKYIYTTKKGTTTGSDALDCSSFMDFRKVSPDLISREVSIKINRIGSDFQFNIKPHNIMRKRINEKVKDKKMDYVRWSSSGILMKNNAKLEGIFEYMSFT